MEPVIRVENLSKRYHLGAREPYRALREVLAGAIQASFRTLERGKERHGAGKEKFIWALKDVSFEVKRGEVIGVVGRNGAGKTTLLKVLSRVTKPTQGRAQIYGSVGSLLEVGTGLHPELSGRENIFLMGAILGMKRREIRAKFDEIVAFAEVEKFLDTPVKRYSSGMYLRLAFAVAAHLEPDVLLVDEVLAVGDAVFQKKCLGKMGDVVQEGRTVLFVSHNMLAIRDMCRRCLWIHEGRVASDGEVGKVVGNYLSRGMAEMPSALDTRNWDRPQGFGEDLKVTKVCFQSRNGQARILCGDPLVLEMEVEVTEPAEDVAYGFSVYSPDGVRLFHCHNTNEGRPYPRFEPGKYRLRGVIDRVPLPPGRYRLDLGIRSNKKGLDLLRDLMMFEVEESRVVTPWFQGPEAFFRQPSVWKEPERLP